MKTVTVGCQINLRSLFISLAFGGLLVSSCGSAQKSADAPSAQQNSDATVIDIQFLKMADNKNLKLNEQDWYVSTGQDFEAKVIQHEFADESSSLKYIFNRRMLLHKNFQNEIAPYFGVIQLNQDCLHLVDTKGDLIEDSKQQSHIQMSFPAKEDYSLFDCSTDKFRAVLKYYFHYCRANNKVYETRFSKKLESNAQVSLSCQ